MNITEIKNYLNKQERKVVGIKFEKSDKSLINENRVNVPESDNWLNLTAITWGFPRRQTSGQVDCDDSANRHLKRSTRKSASSFFSRLRHFAIETTQPKHRNRNSQARRQ